MVKNTNGNGFIKGIISIKGIKGNGFIKGIKGNDLILKYILYIKYIHNIYKVIYPLLVYDYIKKSWWVKSKCKTNLK